MHVQVHELCGLYATGYKCFTIERMLCWFIYIQCSAGCFHKSEFMVVHLLYSEHTDIQTNHLHAWVMHVTHWVHHESSTEPGQECMSQS